ncbi:hypothetical protein V8B97DRAFT_2023344 [Scleroderma yunnanense]
MQASTPELITEFTEDAFAQEDRICKQSKCQGHIWKGDPCHYIATYNTFQPGKFVCGACYQWYQSKPATTASLPDPQCIHQSLSAAQSQGTRAYLSGPDIHVPSAWNKPTQSLPSVMQAPGVTPSGHVMALPMSSHECWACIAHWPPPSETISLEIFASICEGMKDIDALSTAAELASIALKMVVPWIKAYDPLFQWCESEFVDLLRHASPQPYFYNECLQASNHKNSKAMIFVSKQFSLSVVVPQGQWEEFEAFKEKQLKPKKYLNPLFQSYCQVQVFSGDFQV